MKLLYLTLAMLSIALATQNVFSTHDRNVTATFMKKSDSIPPDCSKAHTGVIVVYNKSKNDIYFYYSRYHSNVKFTYFAKVTAGQKKDIYNVAATPDGWTYFWKTTLKKVSNDKMGIDNIDGITKGEIHVMQCAEKPVVIEDE